MANTTYNTVNVTTSATQIVATTGVRKGLIISNTDTSAILYVGPDSSITTANAIPVYPRGTLIMSGFNEHFAGTIWGISSSGTIDTRYWAWGQ